MKHAYLILAHNEFGVLKRLLKALDDERNDIFIHIDKRVKDIPELFLEKGKLITIQDRIKTYWGDSSLIKAELLLMQVAKSTGQYRYYHIISGVHYPMKNQDYFHNYFNLSYPKSLLMKMETNREEICFKAGRYHYFVHSLSPNGTIKATIANLFWRALLLIQKPFPFRDLRDIDIKASQWCSLSDLTVSFILDHKDSIMSRFKHTFCCDEFFIPALLQKGGLEYDYSDKLLFVRFRSFSPEVLNETDFTELKESGCLFARKFGADSMKLLDLIDSQLI